MSAHGTYTTIDGRPAVRFERRLRHPVDAAWRAVTDPAELARWSRALSPSTCGWAARCA